MRILCPTPNISELCTRRAFSFSSRANLKRRPFSSDEDRLMQELSQQGVAHGDIARQMQDRPRTSVSARLRRLHNNLEPKPTHKRRWTAQEDAILQKGRDAGLPYEQLMKNLTGRSTDAAMLRHQQLSQIRSEKGQTINSRNPWTLAEKQRVVDMRATEGLSFGAIAKALGRSLTSVRNVWKQHWPSTLSLEVVEALNPHNDWSPEEESILEEHWKDDVSCADIMRRIPGRTLMAIAERAGSLYLGSPSTKPNVRASRKQIMGIRRALEPVINGTATLDDVARTASSPLHMTNNVFNRMRRNGYKTKVTPENDTPTSRKPLRKVSSVWTPDLAPELKT